MVAVAIGLAVVIAIILGTGRPSAVDVSSGVFSPGSIYGTAGAVFFVTNNGQHAVELVRLEVQVASNHNWTTLSRQTSRFIDPSAPNRDWAGSLGRREVRRIRCDAPDQGPWRVCVDYGTELRGVDGLFARLRTAWATRSSRPFNGGQVFGGELARAVSPEITR